MPRELRYCRPRRDPEEFLLAYLVKRFGYLTETEWRQHIAAGHVSINGAILTDELYRLQQGDMLRFAPPRSLEPPVDDSKIEVLYEDSTLVVVAKNGNLPVAEGGRYCENTLVGLLRRCGTSAFHTAATCVGSVTSQEHAEKVSDGLDNCVEIAETAAPVESSREMSVSRGEAEVSTSPPSRRRLETDFHSNPVDRLVPCVSAPPPEKSLALQISHLTLFTVQRLDKETSGAVVLAKNSATAKSLASQLEAQTKGCTAAVESLLREYGTRTSFSSEAFDNLLRLKAQAVHKTYTAVLRGAAPGNHTFVVVNYMDCVAMHPLHSLDVQHTHLKKLKMCCEPVVDFFSSHTRESFLASPKEKHAHWGKVAATRIRVLASDETLGLTFVEVELLTGRSHQIRLHCAAVGYPVLGDKLYTTTTPGKEGGATAVPDAVYLERVRREDPFLPVGGDDDDDASAQGAWKGRKMWCRRHLLHATRITFSHPDASPPRRLMCTSSPVSFFAADVRFESQEDSSLFNQLLTHAFSQSLAGCEALQSCSSSSVYVERLGN
ncbi:hypothetical protein JKF63_02978 [Porcisia hertigi]|uniref:RNA-binding S4 domain-containing protein n=1 Tax=Porcisia hertigi TaxID=2761500 RepID=A0A836HT88_9TRYP|nr:hypothetical protein JKF63_02978 [Porcisia hertigi]